MKKIVLVLLMVVFVLVAGSVSAQSINFGTYPVSVVEKTTEAMGSPYSVVSRSVGTLKIIEVWHINFEADPLPQAWQCGFVFTIPGYERPMYFLIRLPQIPSLDQIPKSGVFVGDSGAYPMVEVLPNWSGIGHDFSIPESPDPTDVYFNSNIYGTWTIRGKYAILSGTITRVFQCVDNGEFTGFSSIGFSVKIPLTSN